jgi:hypothetical protein
MLKRILKDRNLNSNDGMKDVIPSAWNDLTFDDGQGLFRNWKNPLPRILKNNGEYTLKEQIISSCLGIRRETGNIVPDFEGFTCFLSVLITDHISEPFLCSATSRRQSPRPCHERPEGRCPGPGIDYHWLPDGAFWTAEAQLTMSALRAISFILLFWFSFHTLH